MPSNSAQQALNSQQTVNTVGNRVQGRQATGCQNDLLTADRPRDCHPRSDQCMYQSRSSHSPPLPPSPVQRVRSTPVRSHPPVLPSPRFQAVAFSSRATAAEHMAFPCGQPPLRATDQKRALPPHSNLKLPEPKSSRQVLSNQGQPPMSPNPTDRLTDPISPWRKQPFVLNEARTALKPTDESPICVP